MSKKPTTKRVVLAPERPPDSFTRAQLIKAIKKVTANRRRKQKSSVSNGTK